MVCVWGADTVGCVGNCGVRAEFYVMDKPTGALAVTDTLGWRERGREEEN